MVQGWLNEQPAEHGPSLVQRGVTCWETGFQTVLQVAIGAGNNHSLLDGGLCGLNAGLSVAFQVRLAKGVVGFQAEVA